ncbi:replication initiation factor domain-containing protein [Carnobacterium divergens]|uniref:replication initiation factor domain-containing protein n=1 Tax=Carnobacterium divergens TaxID=2748 RepID=UPI0039C9EBFA
MILIKTSLAYVTCKIDWLRILFKGTSLLDIMNNLLKIELDCFLVGEGSVKHKDYNTCYTYGAIRIYTYGLSVTEETECYLEMSGEACSLYEELLKAMNRNWKQFFQELFYNYESLFETKRLDLAMDDFNKIPFFTIEQLYKKCKKNEYYSNRRGYDLIESKFRGTDRARTLYIGKRSSDIMFRIYDKDKEKSLKTAIELEELGSWKRLEIEIKHGVAHSLLKIIAFEELSLETITRGFIKQELTFYSNSELNKTARFWLNYLGNTIPLKIERHYEITGLSDTERWLENGGAITAVKAFEFLKKNKALGNLTSIYSMYESAQYSQPLANKIISHLISINREDLISEVYEDTKKPNLEKNNKNYSKLSSDLSNLSIT